jgi:hypothetical protein
MVSSFLKELFVAHIRLIRMHYRCEFTASVKANLLDDGISRRDERRSMMEDDK